MIGHFLLDGEESSLRMFSSELVMGLQDDQLGIIAREDAGTKDRRAMAEFDVRNLQAAMEILHS